MNIKEARAAIEEILASIPDSELPDFDRIEVDADGKTCAWWGGHGRYLGSAERGEERRPLLYREGGTWDAIEGEMFYRADKRFLENGDKPHGIKLGKKTVLR